MKIHIELNYILPEQPLIFNIIDETQTRKVYIWGNKRTLLENDGAMESFIYRSEITEEPVLFQNNFCNMDIWEYSDVQPPPKIDDSWIEKYKIIKEPTFYLEWHQEPKLLRLSWSQNQASFLETKLKAPVLEQLQRLSLELPPFAKLQV